MARKEAEALPPLSTTLLPAESGDVPAPPERTLELRGLPGQRSLGVDRPLPTNPPDPWPMSWKIVQRRAPACCVSAYRLPGRLERWNNTLRQRLDRPVRKTLSCSKGERVHKLAWHLSIHKRNQPPVI